ncbi:hypothetical protein ONZ45_g3363 [Pleurotus djamor]|nr:hypothetical protein ONZ45_g3363 [Pleurotus djamor]
MKRTEDLSISSRESDILVLLRALGNVPVPCLRKLTLEHRNGNPSYDDDAAIEISLPWTTLPFLTSLELCNIIPLAPPVLPSLQSLSIIIPPDERQLSVPWIVDLLRNTPQVEEVDVSSLASTNATAVSGPLPVSLPRLRQLTVTAEFLLESKLFEYLDIPQTAAIDVMLRNQINDPHADDLSPLQALHARPFESGLPLFMSIAVIAYPETYQYSLLMRGSDSKLLSLSLMECPTSAVSQSIQLCRSLPLNQVHDLRIFAYANLEITLAWAKLLPLLTNLQSVTTDCKTALRELTADSPDTKDLCNPKLESVVLKEEGHIDRGEEEGDDWPMLVRAFKYRYEKGRPIKSLSISSCDIRKEYVDDLKVYTDVDWDGVEMCGGGDNEF